MEQHWPVLGADGGAPAGVARWAVYSFALERNIAVVLVDAGLDPAAGSPWTLRTGRAGASRTRSRSSERRPRPPGIH